jgi:glycine/D-amino acid oxidase-like deaminating enzyme
MKAAVVGAGYTGLAVCWHLLKKQIEVTVFDGGEGASHASTGLLHPYPGKKATLTWRAKEGMQATLELLEVASNEKPVFLKNGILRIAATDEQKMKWGQEKILIPEGITVFSRTYLQELKRACPKAQFENRWIHDLEELKDFDLIVLTTGAESLQWASLPLKRSIGQCLVCRCKEPISMSLLSSGHITPTPDPEFCLVGSTYEYTPKPDPKKALALLEKVATFYPLAKEFKVESIESGVRISPKLGYQPIVQKINPKTWILTGFGSRGLIYHALFAKEFASQF